MAHIPVITIDGPGGVGKGTLSQQLAEELGWTFLDSGALYRALALAAQQRQLALNDVSNLQQLAHHLAVEFIPTTNGVAIYLDNVEISAELRTEPCGNAASKIAAYAPVRTALLARQRTFRIAPGLVADGRDMGTVVFPDADLKIYLEASIKARTQRRFAQLQERGLNVNLENLFAEIKQRDQRDKARPVAPLKAATDAIIIDTTELSIKQVATAVSQLVAGKGLR
jgi:cytidylate kinase